MNSTDNNGIIKQITDFFVADNAVVVGDVEIGRNTNIWPYACIRGDVAPIHIGENCSIQDHDVMVHCKHRAPLEIANNVIVGHQACVHCRSVGESTLVGIGAVILDNCIIGKNCLIAAGAVIRPGTVIPDGKMVAGVTGAIIRDISEKDLSYHLDVVSRYVDLAKAHSHGEFRAL